METQELKMDRKKMILEIIEIDGFQHRQSSPEVEGREHAGNGQQLLQKSNILSRIHA